MIKSGELQLGDSRMQKVDEYPREVDELEQRVLMSNVDTRPQTSRLNAISNQSPIQFHKVKKEELEGLNADFDSENYGESIQQIDELVDIGNTTTLKLLHGVLFGKKGKNDAKLVKYIERKLKSGPEIPDKEKMGLLEKYWIGRSFSSQPEVDESVRKGLNMWVVGDTERGINWEMVGKHLRGLLSDEDYKLIGMLSIMKSGKKEEDDKTLIKMGRELMNAVRGDIRVALDKLPDFTGKTYRLSSIKDTSVFADKIKKGDLIKDTTFWSTAAVRGAGAAAEKWGNEGTTAKPMAYFIIESATGKYIAKYSKIEGEREVLFKDNVIFRVLRIVNLGTTFYVYIQELKDVPRNTLVKNPFTGDPYPIEVNLPSMEPLERNKYSPEIGPKKAGKTAYKSSVEVNEPVVRVVPLQPQNVRQISQTSHGIYIRGNSTVNSRGITTEFVEVGFYEEDYRADGIPLEQQVLLQDMMRRALQSPYYMGQTSNMRTGMVLRVELSNAEEGRKLFLALVEKSKKG